MVRYLARFALSTEAIDPRTSGARRTATSSSTASASCCLALSSESSVRAAAGSARVTPVQAASASAASSSVCRMATRSLRRQLLVRDRFDELLRGFDLDDPSRSPTTFDAFAESDEGQLTASDLLRQASSLARVFDLEQLVGVRDRVFAHRHQVLDLRRRAGEPQSVLEVALVLAELLGEATDAVAVLLDHPVVHHRFLERREVLALEVLDDRDLEGGVVVQLFDEGRDRGEPAGLGRAPAPFAGDELVPTRVVDRPDEDRLQDAVLADGSRELVEGRLLEPRPRLGGIGIDPLDRDVANAERLGRHLGREQAQDLRTELTLLRQSSTDRRAEVGSSQGRSPPGRARGTYEPPPSSRRRP